MKKVDTYTSDVVGFRRYIMYPDTDQWWLAIHEKCYNYASMDMMLLSVD